MYPPFATPDAWGAYAASSKSNSVAPSPVVAARPNSAVSSSSALENEGSRPNTATTSNRSPSSAAERTETAPTIQRSVTQGSRPQIQTHTSTINKSRKRKKQDRWWRVSDDKIKEAKTSDVLGMQREVYLLFYELERPEIAFD